MPRDFGRSSSLGGSSIIDDVFGDDDAAQIDQLISAARKASEHEMPASGAHETAFRAPKIADELKFRGTVHTDEPQKSARFSVEEGKASEDEIEQAERERQSAEDRRKTYQRPPLSLLHYDPTARKGYDQDQLEALATRIEDKLAEFNILGEIINICPGPVVTRFASLRLVRK